MQDKTKKTISWILISIVFITVIIAFIFRDVLFTSVVEIKYPDGCKETYKNNILTTALCTNGRIMAEANKQKLLDKQQNNYPSTLIYPIGINVTK